MKKFLSGVLVGALLTISGTALAANVEKIEAYFRPDFQVSVNGQAQELKNAPVTVNGSMYLPLREVGTILGYNVEWNEQTKTAELTKPSESLNQVKGENQMNYDGVVFYNLNEVNKNLGKIYGLDYKKNLIIGSVKNGVIIREYNGVEYSTENAISYYDSNNDTWYYDKSFFLQFLQPSDLEGLPTYTINPSTKTIIQNN